MNKIPHNWQWIGIHEKSAKEWSTDIELATICSNQDGFQVSKLNNHLWWGYNPAEGVVSVTNLIPTINARLYFGNATSVKIMDTMQAFAEQKHMYLHLDKLA